MLLLALSPALAGYADAVDGLPTHEERETFLWTNAARIDPASFTNDYPCSFGSFAAAEQTTKPLLWHNDGLTAAADYHSTDMDVDGYFDHDSNDGTPWDVRIMSYYSGGWVGENIAWGYSSPFSAVIEGWMCSSGHRANIMSSSYQELGTGVSSDYWTQDFGTGTPPSRVMAMGIHLPEQPAADVVLAVDLEVPVPVDALYAVLDGARTDLTLSIGTDTRGLWTATVPVPAGDCHTYYFVAESGPVLETWPETGSYGWGGCAFDDPGAGWLATQEPLPAEGTTTPGGGTTTVPGGGTTTPGGGTDPTGTTASGTDPTGETPAPLTTGCGCGSTGSGGAVLGALGALAVGAGRRRRTR
jgi:MYXO-CTERM domain-containing protein